MCVYIGIEDLVANAIIELVQENKKGEVLFKDLNRYGAKVVEILMRDSGKKAVLILSNESKMEFINDYSDFFELFENENNYRGVRLKEGITVTDLCKEFRGYLSVDVMSAFVNKESVAELSA